MWVPYSKILLARKLVEDSVTSVAPLGGGLLNEECHINDVMYKLLDTHAPLGRKLPVDASMVLPLAQNAGCGL